MLLQLLGLATIAVFAIFVAKTAKEYGRNGFGWAVACVALGLALQWIFPIVAITAIAAILVVLGTAPDRVRDSLDGWAMLITILFLILSVIGMFLILRKVARPPDEEVATGDEPPPPTFYDTK